MSYGRGGYGTSVYGGYSLSGGPTLVSSNPVDLATGIQPDVVVVFTIDSPAGLSEFLISVEIDGVQVIVGGVFQPGYTGTIQDANETQLVITLLTHPTFAGDLTTVDIHVTDLATVQADFSFSFTVDAQSVSESVAVSEAVVVAQNFSAPVVVESTVSINEELETGGFLIEVLDATTIQVTFPQELRFDGSGDLNNFSIKLAPETNGGAPVTLVSVDQVYDTLQSGSSIRVVEVVWAEYSAAALPLPEVFGLNAFSSNVLDLNGTATVVENNLWDYIEITNGLNPGRYQITDLYTSNDGVVSDLISRVPRVILDRTLSTADTANGYVSGLAEVIQISPNPILRLLNVTASDPLVQVMSVENRTQSNTLDLLTLGLNPSAIEFTNHNTFQINEGGAISFPVALNDRVLIQARVTPKLEWRHTSGVQKLIFKSTKPTANKEYIFEGGNLFNKATRAPVSFSARFTPASSVAKPKVLSASFLPVDGTVLVQFDQAMQVDDDNLGNVDDYAITGPTTVSIKQVRNVNPSTVALHTLGLGAGDYTLTISTSTPKDVAGNPLDPVFNSVVFTSAIPETTRSIFTDKGPIAKPPETLQTGVNAVLATYNEVTLPAAVLTVGMIGKYLTISGGVLNGGTFRISSVLTATRCRLANTSFTLPDPDSGTLSWEVFDPRDGQLADDPADVVVRINSVPVTPLAVIGLLGQVILDATPAPTDDVKVDYSWCCNPTVEMRRLNSRELRLNAWNRDVGYPIDNSQHKYRYNNVLIRPSDFEADNMSAKLDQPVSRELHYRAYERAYTATLNDPSLLVLNSPINRVAYPPAQRQLSETFVAYNGIGLPESLANGWTRHGGGIASATGGYLTTLDDSTGSFPTGQPIYWTKPIDLTFDHVFAMSWRFSLDLTTTLEGVFTGVAAGYSDERTAVIVGYLNDGGTKKIGILKKGFGDNPSLITSWTDLEVLDWETLRSYRILRELSGLVSVYVDGDTVPTLQVAASELPSLVEVNAAFSTLQGVFFGSISRPGESSSTWDFVRYLIQPTSPQQASPSSFVNFEATVEPEADAKPWTPVGFHGDGTILSSNFLLLDNSSATDVTTASDVGLVGGDYRGYVRFEPLFSRASEFVVDVNVKLVTQTHGVALNGLTLAVDDGTHLMQVSFFPHLATPKFSYGGRSLPEDFSPYVWSALGGATSTLVGRQLRITDSSLLDGKVYFIEDTEPVLSDGRVVGGATDYILEFRNKVVSYTVDGSGFAGAFVQAYDSTRAVGLLLREVASVKYVSFHSDGVVISSIVFDWGDAAFHTYRLSKSTGGDLVSLFIDGVFVGSEAYSNFTVPAANPIGLVSFGSSTPSSTQALSVVDWAYCNAWRLRADLKHYVGLWNGLDQDSLLGYHLPLKTSGKGASISGNTLNDSTTSFLTTNVVAGDALIVDVGPNSGIYEVAAVGGANTLTIVGVWPASPSLVDYRIAKETDWTVNHKYRLVRDPQGEVALLFDAETAPLIRVSYGALELPVSGSGLVQTLGNGLPAIAWGSFDSENLSQSNWNYVRYGITTAPTENRIVPHHQVLNQWNVMCSPERLFTLLPHTLTSFKSSSTGHPPKIDPDFLASVGLTAFTILNQGTPLVPSTQTYEIRSPYPVEEFISALNTPADVLNSNTLFTLNDSTKQYRLVIPDDVLYSSLDVIEQLDDGVTDIIAPYDDDCGVTFGGFQYTKEVCLEYLGAVLPEADTGASTPWELVSDTPANVNASSLGGILTYGTNGVGTKTVYRNNSPLPDAPSLQTEAKFRLKVVNDATLGTGDTQIKFGLSAPGFTVALTFVTTALGERFVLVIDQNNGNILGSATLDFLDGAFHTFRLIRSPCDNTLRVFVDS